tara:strand:- start:1405 stop:2889 length:1485 start_codon:yes stop_codon:yes gene_type:complete
MEDAFIYCEEAETKFGKTKKSVSHNGDVSVDYLTSNTSPTIVTGSREYQREKVAPLSWKQLIMLTVISNGYRKIPQVHIRVIKTNKTFRFELIDGQQRITSIIDFIRGGYSLPNTDDFNLGNGIDVRGMNITDIKENYPQVHQQIFGYRISCLWYENLSDEQTADLFINVLNNTNSMKPQEIRNAVRGFLSEYVRNSSRFENRLDLFERTFSDGKSKKQRLKHFSDSFSLSGRMEVDEWLSELIYLLQNGYRNGITQNRHTQFIKDVQQQGGSLGTSESFGEFSEDVLQPLEKFSYDVITSTPPEYKYKLTPMLSQMLILYGYELKNKYGKLITDVYVKKFFSVYDMWSSNTQKLYSNELMFGTQDEQMEPFNKLFGGKNKKAIGTITYVLDMELKKDEDSFGVIEIDARDFTKPQIIKKWEEQGRKCFFTGHPLALKDIAGDHYIPRSWGVKKGGVTEIDNLVVTSKKLNLRKLNVHGDDFKKMLNEEIELVA